MDIQVLELSKYNPNADIIIVYVNVDKMQRANELLMNTRNELAPLFRRRGFDSVFIPQTCDGRDSTIKVSETQKSAPENELNDNAYDPQPDVEDFVFPNNPDQRGSKVTTLPSSPHDSTEEEQDLQYFSERMAKAMKQQAYAEIAKVFSKDDSGQTKGENPKPQEVSQNFQQFDVSVKPYDLAKSAIDIANHHRDD